MLRRMFTEHLQLYDTSVNKTISWYYNKELCLGRLHLTVFRYHSATGSIQVLLAREFSEPLRWATQFVAPAGQQAVDVFFVLSGFVIAHVSATREHSVLQYVIAAPRGFTV